MPGLLMAGCTADPCISLCTEVAAALDGCLVEWGASWEDLGADSRTDYRVTCQDQWDVARAALEVRQVPEEEDRCTAGAAALNTLGCAELRVLYLDP